MNADTLMTLIKHPNLRAPLPLHRFRARERKRERERDGEGANRIFRFHCVSSNLLLDQAGIITVLRTGWMLRSDRLPVSIDISIEHV